LEFVVWKQVEDLQKGDTFFDGYQYRYAVRVETSSSGHIAVWFRYIHLSGREAGFDDKNEFYLGSDNNLTFYPPKSSVEVLESTI
jgi:hypothetical protein